MEVVRDKYGVPRIYAQTVEDLFFAQGYVQAQDRFWQMELYRRAGSGRPPSPGWTDDYEWKGYIPFEELPYVYNPPKGYIVVCNNPPVSENYPYFIGSSHSFGYRAKRGVDMIEADADGISVEDVIKMQADAVDQGALQVISYLDGLDLSIKGEMEIEVEEEVKKEETDKERIKREEAEAASFQIVVD